MASDYGRNFGFRRSDESVAVREGRFRTPASGSLLQGSLVTIDASSAGYLKVAPANSPAVTGVTGLLVQEEAQNRTIYESERVDSFGLGATYKNTLSTVVSGAGVKFWVKNTAGQTRADGRVIPSVTMFDPTSLAVGAKLGWDGSKYLLADGSTIKQVATVTAITTGQLEAVLVA